MSNTVISVENISKRYRLGVIGSGTLRGDFQRWWHKLRRKEDPFAKVQQGAMDQRPSDNGGFIWALRNVNFTVEQGDVLGIIGRNGAGKSTILKILSRVTSPTEGRIHLEGRVASLLEVGTGFHPELTGRENIFLNGTILGMTKREIKNKFDEIVDFSEIGSYIDTPVKRYSSGMYVRLAFAVAAHLEPEILIVDEVLAVGDFAFQKKCLGKMGTVASEGRTVLFVSHNMAAIGTLCRRAILFEHGNVVEDGEVQSIINRYYEDSGQKAVVVDIKNVDESKPRIIRACVINVDGTPVQQILMGQPFGIQVEFRSPWPLTDPILGVRINTSLGSTILGVSNHMHHKEPLCIGKNEGTIRVLFNKHCLNQGTYYVTLNLSSDGVSHDRVADIIWFNINPVDLFGTGQIPKSNQSAIIIDGKWSFEEIASHEFSPFPRYT